MTHIFDRLKHQARISVVSRSLVVFMLCSLSSRPDKRLQPFFNRQHVVKYLDLLNVFVQEHVTLVEDLGHFSHILDALCMLVEGFLTL